MSIPDSNTPVERVSSLMEGFWSDARNRCLTELIKTELQESRELLLQRTQEDRRKRELLKKQQNSSIKIQSCFRSARARHTAKQEERELFDVFYQRFPKTARGDASGQQVSDMVELARLTRQFLFFYNPRVDNDRLTGLCQLIVRLQVNVVRSIVFNEETAVYQMKRLLQICCRLLGKDIELSGSVAIPLRMVEIFTDPDVYRRQAGALFSVSVIQNILEHLIRNGYYHSMRALMDSKVPTSIERPESLMSSQTSIAGTLLELIRRPISLLASTEYDSAFKSVVLRSLCSEMFCRPHTEAISRLLIPDLVNGKVPFPFQSFLLALVPSNHMIEIGTEKTDRSDWSLTVQSSVWLLYSVLRLSEHQLDKLSNDSMLVFLIILHKLVPHLRVRKRKSAFDDEFSDTDEETMDIEQESETLEVCQECLKILESQPIASCLLLLSQRNDLHTLTALCTLCHTLMEEDCMEIHKTRLLYSLAFNSHFLRNLWFACLSISTQSNNGFQSTLLQMLSRGLPMSTFDLNRIVPMLSIFCSHFSHFMMSLHDSEFHGDSSNSKNVMPFKLDELPHIAQTLCEACLGIIELTHPDTKPVIGVHHNVISAEDLNHQQEMLMAVFKVIVKLVKQLYDRDCRRQFCPDGHWLSSRVSIQLERLYIPNGNVFVRRPFGTQSILNPRRTLDDDTPLLSNTDVRRNIILSEMPFVVPFEERVKVFHRLVHQDKQDNQGSNHVFGMGHSISIMIRRSHLYEDAFEKLSSENEPNLKKRMQVQLVNFAGLDEVGIDGGGIFREFMSELIKTAFDPNRGFFKCTSDKLLYPNPQAKLLVDNFTSHYYFLGRILGKVIYENMLTEMPFASFFLSKLLSRHRGDVDIHHLASLDPEMYKNLLSLKDYEGDISDLGLDFTVVNNELGEAQVEELKPGGKDTLVTNQNHIEYIHLMADYRLNKQMRQHCSAFRSGLADVINIDWLRMFDHNELQLVISGAQTPIDLNDLKQNTNYSGGYGPEHPVIVKFWRVVENFTDKQKRQLLKFATSCSRPPLLGFKELYPAFCIHYAGSEPDRLPTASTCMNLLKLPEFQSEETLRLKLLYAIESGSGFELS